MTTKIKHVESLNHKVPFYDDELLRGEPAPWTIDESERNIIAHYFSYGEGFQWFISYYEPGHNLAYGFVRKDGDSENSSWHEIEMGVLEGLSVTQPVFVHGSRVELTIPVVERDREWQMRTFKEVRQMPEYSWINESTRVQPLR